MVLDKLENVGLYKSLSPRIAKAMEYLKSTDFSKVENGKYEIEGEDIYAMVNEYDTKEASACKLEGHQVYLDVQFMSRGTEGCGYIPYKGQQPVEGYDPVKDRAFYKEKTSIFKFEENAFAIFWPEDLHQPGIVWDKPEKVKKVVVKVKL